MNDSAGGAAFFEVDDELEEEVAVLKQLTWCYVIENPSLAISQRGQREIILGLFKCYLEAIESNELKLFPAAYREAGNPCPDRSREGESRYRPHRELDGAGR